MFYFIILITLTTGRTRTGEKGLPGPPGHREVERDKKSKRVPGTICEDVPMQETNEKQKEMGGKKRRDKKRSKQNLSTSATWATNPSTSISRPKFESTG